MKTVVQSDSYSTHDYRKRDAVNNGASVQRLYVQLWFLTVAAPFT